MLTKEDVEKKLEEAVKSREQMAANFNVISGYIKALEDVLKDTSE
jgi:hypothetical protein